MTTPDELRSLLSKAQLDEGDNFPVPELYSVLAARHDLDTALRNLAPQLLTLWKAAQALMDEASQNPPTEGLLVGLLGHDLRAALNDLEATDD